MIVDLEAEKAVDSSKRLGIVSGDTQLRTALGILSLTGDLAFQLLHGLYTSRTSFNATTHESQRALSGSSQRYDKVRE
jgi:hypothetical protein